MSLWCCDLFVSDKIYEINIFKSFKSFLLKVAFYSTAATQVQIWVRKTGLGWQLVIDVVMIFSHLPTSKILSPFRVSTFLRLKIKKLHWFWKVIGKPRPTCHSSDEIFVFTRLSIILIGTETLVPKLLLTTFARAWKMIQTIQTLCSSGHLI